MITDRDLVKKVDNYIYNTSNVLGFGSSSVVYLGKQFNTHQIVAIRVINLKKLNGVLLELLQSEMDVLGHLPSHPNILKVHKILKTQNNVYFITEYCDSKLVIDENSDIYSISYGIISGMKHLIQNLIVHRDIKPQNIMIKNGIPKIIDFGFSKILRSLDEIMIISLGSPNFMSPQVLQQLPYTSKAEIWSLGVTLYQLLYQRHPFIANTQSQLLWLVKNTKPMFFSNNKLSQIIKNCLLPNQNQRCSWDQLFFMAEGLKSNSTIKQSNPNIPMLTSPKLMKTNSYDYHQSLTTRNLNTYYN